MGKSSELFIQTQEELLNEINLVEDKIITNIDLLIYFNQQRNEQC